MILRIYIIIYVILVVSYLWYRFILRFITDIKSKKEYPEYNAKCSIIIPSYNEKEYRLEMCVKSVIKAKGDNQIIVVDDCSTNKSWEKIKEIKKKFPEIIAIRINENKGKRMAQYYGLKFATGEIIITIDSDTIINENSIIELIKPFNDKNVGATTGNVRVLNREINFLTKMIDSRYRNAFTFERAALSSFGFVTCCSGVISAYRREILERIKEEYINQIFLNKKCTYGDDRYLTNLILMREYKVFYVKDALAYTDAPYKLKDFIKQQIRWKKSFIRESLVTFSYSYKINKLLFIENSYNFIIPFFSLLIRILLIYSIITYPLLSIPIIISIAMIAVLRNLILFIEEGAIAFYSIPYAFLHELIIYWLYWYALFTLKETKWGTR